MNQAADTLDGFFGSLQGALCTACGKQNDLGVKFCVGCGTKLPGTVRKSKRHKRVTPPHWPNGPRFCPTTPRGALAGMISR